VGHVTQTDDVKSLQYLSEKLIRKEGYRLALLGWKDNIKMYLEARNSCDCVYGICLAKVGDQWRPVLCATVARAVCSPCVT
jgi:hypothetical protein